MPNQAAVANANTSFDPFFEVIRGGEWNACIGCQSTAENYVDGYMEAALELASAVIDKRQFDKRDTLVMPILYNARHAVELALKFIIDSLAEGGLLPERHAKNHDIKSHWELMVAAKLGDTTLRELGAALKPFIDSLHGIDEDGQQLRYAETQEGQKSLEDKAVCNLELIRASLQNLNKLLLQMRHRALDLVEEHRAGTFTKELSRRDLFEAAYMLPPRDRWAEEAFTQAKAKVRDRFGLSSNQFCRALDVMQAHRELGGLLGLEFDLAHLTDADVRLIIGEWSKANPEPRGSKGDLGLDYFKVDREALAEHWRAAVAADKAILATLSPDKIADLQTSFYVGSLKLFSEEYAPRLASARREIAVGDPWEMVHHIMTKSSLPRALARGVEVLGRRALAAEIRAMRADFAD